MSQTNPLKQYFRQPAVYIRLPSNGRFYPPGALNPSVTGEYPVYPMTAIDEITYRTPDSLFNGQSTVNVIKSCMPDITDAWAIPATDMDAILAAIRMASYGHEMEFGSTCPSCRAQSDRAIDLRSVLESLTAGDYDSSVQSGDMEIFFRPMSYKNLSDNNRMQYENQKLLQMMPDLSDSEQINEAKITAVSDALKKITEVTVHALAQSIAAVKTPTAMVHEPEYIEEMLKNCDRRLFAQIRDHAIDLKSQSEMQPMQLTCDECNHVYQQQLTLDMSSFFDRAS